MQLHVARLCLDCQEVHDSQTCPMCSSESFAYITRWIPAADRRVTPRAAEPAPQAETYRQLLASDRADRAAPPGTSRWLKRGVFGLAAVSAAAWALKKKAPGDDAGSDGPPPPSDRTVP